MNYQGIQDKELAEQLRRFANGSNVHSDFYFAGRNHARTTNNDKDAMQRVIYGRALPGDKERILDLADDIERGQ